MALSYYDKPYIFFDNGLDGEAHDVQIQYQGEYIPAATFVKDLGGFTPSPKMCKVTVKRFQPSAGWGVIDPVGKFLTGEFVACKIQFAGSGLAMTMSGVVQPPSISGSTTSATETTFTIDGEAKPFEGGLGL